jgi:anti-sigma F factor antagonist
MHDLQDAAQPPAALRLDVEAPNASSRVLTPHGEVDAHTAPALRQAVAEQLLDPEVTQLVIDLSHATFLDSSALGVLIGAFKRMTERGGRLDVVQPSAPLRRIFEITALDRILSLRESRQEALASGDREHLTEPD